MYIYIYVSLEGILLSTNLSMLLTTIFLEIENFKWIPLKIELLLYVSLKKNNYIRLLVWFIDYKGDKFGIGRIESKTAVVIYNELL